jgi:diguanylate cyclase (GGDEF)-like protein
LTGLLNRRALFETGELLINKITGAGGRLAVMFADMDKFKSINDTYGHGVGDQVLRELGAILRDSVRSVDVVARYGGDEFVLLLSETSLDDAEIIARRIQERVDACAKERGLDYSVTIGLGEAPDDGATLDAILESVDQALYQCKSENGGGGVRRVARGLRSGATA